MRVLLILLLVIGVITPALCFGVVLLVVALFMAMGGDGVNAAWTGAIGVVLALAGGGLTALMIVLGLRGRRGPRGIQIAGEPVATWQAAERLACAHMRSLGFRAELTPRGADGGIDVWSPEAAAQVKFRGAKTGRPDLQRLRGAVQGGGVALFYSASGYTDAAIEFANRANLALFVYTVGRDVRCVGSVSARLVRAVSSTRVAGPGSTGHQGSRA